MNLTWHGQYTLKIVSQGKTLVVDPNSSSTGLSSFRAKADIVILSNPANKDMSNLSGIQGDPLIIDEPGEYSLNQISIYSRGWHHPKLNDELTIHRWNIENLTILYLGALNRKLDDIELQELEKTNIHILILPIGGTSSIDTPTALDIVTTIEPNIVIPVHFKLPNLTEKLSSVDQFASELGASSRKKDSKLNISLNKINLDSMSVVILKHKN